MFSAQKHIPLMTGPNPEYLQKLSEYATGGVEIPIYKTFPLSAFKAAYELAEKGGYIGKIVMVIE
jgi:hypothetical protein